MKEVITNCFCDNCNAEMTESFYEEKAIRLNIQADVPNPAGRYREVNGCQMRICDTCGESIGIVKEKIHTGIRGDKGRLKETVTSNIKSIIQMLTKYLKK